MNQNDISLFKKYVCIFDYQLNNERLYNNTCLILENFNLTYRDLEESKDQQFQGKDDFEQQYKRNEYINQEIPEWLTDAEARLIEKDIRNLSN